MMNKIGILGCGVMGEALAKAMLKKTEGKNIFLFDIDTERTKKLAEKFSCKIAASSKDLVKTVDFLLLAIKPIHVKNLLTEIASEYYQKKSVLISIVAGIQIESLENMLYSALPLETEEKRALPIIRLMPNVSVLVEEGMIAFSSNDAVQTKEKDFVIDILEKTGKIELVPENLMDAVTAISGSGPAYGFLFIEALADAAVLLGIPRKQAYIYAAQTLKGAAEMVLETGEQPGVLKDSVCSPGGTTIEAVKKLEEKGFRSAIMEAAEAAFKKSRSLGKK
ncbi:MAG: pyrroline-5-carboxylate reductase [Treponema sp.]|jgi:pyrroline-5-carboxylate reductase|nr:pyrroline-5-carboxylate reductase [Treponema sp.]